MPLLKRSPFTLLETPDDLEPHEHVFQVRFTKEIFRDYQEYLKRIDFYRKRLWTCKVTGKSNLTYEEALVSEQQASEKAQQFPEELIGPVLRIVQYSMLPLRDLLVTITSKLQDVMVEGLELQGKRDGCVCSCKIIKVLDDKEGQKYEVAWLDKDKKMNGSAVVSEGDLIKKRLPYTRDVLKSFIRESTYRNVPWVIHKNLASKYDISTDPPEELKGQVSIQNGCIVSCRKRKKHDVSEEENNEDKEAEKEHINYPIDDLLLQPIDDDAVMAERPSPSRDFRVPMDCVGNLMMVWDFCTSFGRLLKLSPFSLEDFESAIFYKDSNISIIVETHSALLHFLIRDEGEYFTTIMKRKRKPKVLALRRPILHKVLDYEDEFFSLLMLVLEMHSLRTTDASFAESLYGLRRRAVQTKLKKDVLNASSTDSINYSGLEKRQKVLSVVFLVVLPYLKSKLHSVYNKEREAALQASLWGPGDETFDGTEYMDAGASSIVPAQASESDISARAHLLRTKKIISACYPLIHAGHEGLAFAYQLLYLLDATGFYSLGLHILGIHVCRATGQELMDASSRISKIRSRERERLQGPPWLKKFLGAALTGTYAVLDYAQTGLIASVFIFKMMEWWYQSAEERMHAPVVYPPPPPPPAPKVAKEGIPLPPDRTICALCSQKRANPSALTVSGFVFCYACIFKYVSQYKRCPVTLIPAEPDDIRRLFHDM